MANIRTDVDYTIVDGAEIIFKAPCDSCTVTGLKVYYPNSDGITVNEVFVFKDAHGNELTDLDTFKANAMVKVILNTTDHIAHIQNADTNAYLEGKFEELREDMENLTPKTHTHTKSQITDFPTSMPASDVSAWAKASTKPTYKYSEITDKPSTFTPSSHNQGASTITAGTLGGKVQANASAMATLTNAQLRDAVILDSDPGEGATVSYNPGTIVFTK